MPEFMMQSSPQSVTILLTRHIIHHIDTIPEQGRICGHLHIARTAYIYLGDRVPSSSLYYAKTFPSLAHSVSPF